MPELDPFTLTCVTILIAYLSSGAMYFMSKLNGRTNGMSVCAGAGFLMATGLLLRRSTILRRSTMRCPRMF